MEGAFVDLITSVGFPIAVCIYLFWSNERSYSRFDARDIAMREAIERNTEALKHCKMVYDVKTKVKE